MPRKKRSKRQSIALVRSSQGGEYSLSNASANAYAQALRDEGFDVDEIQLEDVPYVDQWDSKFSNKHKSA